MPNKRDTKIDIRRPITNCHHCHRRSPADDDDGRRVRIASVSSRFQLEAVSVMCSRRVCKAEVIYDCTIGTMFYKYRRSRVVVVW